MDLWGALIYIFSGIQFSHSLYINDFVDAMPYLADLQKISSIFSASPASHGSTAGFSLCETRKTPIYGSHRTILAPCAQKA